MHGDGMRAPFSHLATVLRPWSWLLTTAHGRNARPIRGQQAVRLAPLSSNHRGSSCKSTCSPALPAVAALILQCRTRGSEMSASPTSSHRTAPRNTCRVTNPHRGESENMTRGRVSPPSGNPAMGNGPTLKQQANVHAPRQSRTVEMIYRSCRWIDSTCRRQANDAERFRSFPKSRRNVARFNRSRVA